MEQSDKFTFFSIVDKFHNGIFLYIIIVGISCPKNIKYEENMQRCYEFNPQNKKCVPEKDLCDERKGCGEISFSSNGAEVDTSRHCIKGIDL